jgi:hypothetical protein
MRYFLIASQVVGRMWQPTTTEAKKLDVVINTAERRANMNEQEKAVVQSIVKAFDALPDEKKEYLIGFAEGVAAMKSKEESK